VTQLGASRGRYEQNCKLKKQTVTKITAVIFSAKFYIFKLEIN
jgi:hypothetical protein